MPLICYFTSEGKACWGFFRPEKCNGFGRVWNLPKTSTLRLDHRSRFGDNILNTVHHKHGSAFCWLFTYYGYKLMFTGKLVSSYMISLCAYCLNSATVAYCEISVRGHYACWACYDIKKKAVLLYVSLQTLLAWRVLIYVARNTSDIHNTKRWGNINRFFTVTACFV